MTLHSNNKQALVNCVKALYQMGLTSSVSGNHSIRIHKNWMWITPSKIPRYKLTVQDLVKVNLRTNNAYGKLKPSIEWQMHALIYEKLENINAIIHTHSPYSLGISISHKFQNVIEEAQLVVGNPVIIPNKPSGSASLAMTVADAFNINTKAVIIKNHGIVSIGENLDQARAIVESLEEWSKILFISQVFGGPKDLL